MSISYLYSLILEMTATTSTTIPALRGDHTHALFLDLVRQTDPDLSQRLHEEPEYRPFTVSLLQGATIREGCYPIQAGQTYRLRVTLLDGGTLWQRLSAHILSTGKIIFHLDRATFQLTRVISTPTTDTNGWASYTDWQTLGAVPVSSSITLRFASPCAFSMGKRNFTLFPEPALVWGSLVRVWNRYAPAVLQIDRQAIREFVTEHVAVSDYDLHTTRVIFREYAQKGFQGTCHYVLKTEDGYAPQVAALAEFARYASVGSKTTMGMGQVRSEGQEIKEARHAPRDVLREAPL